MNYPAALELARTVARLASDDLETPIGCVVLDADGNVAAIGWNRLPPGVEPRRERRVRPGKYAWMIHAERHAIQTARRSLRGHTMVLPWFPCSDCADRIRLAGIARLVCFAPDFADPRWGEEFRRAEWILRAGSVELVFVEDDVGRVRWLADFAAEEPRRRAEDARPPAEGPAYEVEVL